MKNLEEFFLEPACGHNREKKEEERKKGCSRPKPGSASGGSGGYRSYHRNMPFFYRFEEEKKPQKTRHDSAKGYKS